MTAVEPTNNTALLEAVQRVAERRRIAAAVKATLLESKRGWEAANADLIATAAQTELAQVQAEAEARELGLLHYKRTGEMKPAPGVVLRISAKPVYAADVALRWAQEKQLFLKPEQLDVAAFEAFAKTTELPFVILTEEPKVTLATDLDKALGGGK